MATLYTILEDGQPMDGELLTSDRLWTKLAYAAHNAEVFATDFDEARADGMTPTRLVTEDVVNDWWWAFGGELETWERISSGKRVPGLAERFFPELCARLEGQVAA